TLFYGDKFVSVDTKGFFRLRAEEISNSSKGVLLRAVDAAGNENRLNVKVEIVWTVPGILENLSLWVTASRSEKKAAAVQVGDHLKADFDFLGLKNYRCGAVKYRIASYKHKKTALELRLIPGGRYSMGSKSERGGMGVVNTLPIHTVATGPFLVGAREVSWRSWRRVRPDAQAEGLKDELPVEKRSWETVQSWLVAAGGQLRLPSEVEWEYACRAGTMTPYFWGVKLEDKYCWTSLNTGETSRSVRLHDRAMNAFGLCDMIGNVSEWCEDNYLADYRNAPSNGNPRKILNSKVFVARGGSYNSLWCSFSAGRNRHYKNTAGVGFRVFRSLP
ncbi:MAG: formylglycine-generating enzyme family protein, partial [Planctomycetota bacterium]|nr:formylglycine-generating enzyme family protein [Planctomycetota bacterium]